MNHIIVQAGGRGSRMGALTDNKPKALIPVENLPMLFHLFRQFPYADFIIICDYKKNVMRRYLSAFADVTWRIVETCGRGNCAGLAQAVAMLPDGEPFMLIWSDLLLPSNLPMPKGYGAGEQPLQDFVGLSKNFTCRWMYREGMFCENPSDQYGVAGCFWYTGREKLCGVPAQGEFVQWLADSGAAPASFNMTGTREIGTIEAYSALPVPRCRPFNRLHVTGDKLVKEPIDRQGEKLARCERAWYEKVMGNNLDFIPRIYSLQPLCIEYIHGQALHEYQCSIEEKRRLLKQIVKDLQVLHTVGSVPSDPCSIREAYFNKTIDRLKKVRELIPFTDRQYIIINGRLCRNIYYHFAELESSLDELDCKRFSLIHGDCTFSNILVRDSGQPVFLDPRGYFGRTSLYGDPRYDWAKLYYSVAGNYDSFNMGRFRLEIGGKNGTSGTTLAEGEVHLTIHSNGWEGLSNELLSLTRADEREIKLLHAVIWLSLTTYTWQNYDSICGAFYNGLYYLEEIL